MKQPIASWIQALKKGLRGTVIHNLYELLRYDLKIIVLYRFYYNARKREFRKIRSYVNKSVKDIFEERPRAIGIDIVSCCNLRCPLCSVPPFLTKTRDNFMPFHDFRKIVDSLGGVTSDLTLVYAGEPMLHPQFNEMIEYCTSRYYTTTITNGTLLEDTRIEKLLNSGLDFLQISFDGFSKASYERYRVGARFEKVRDGIVRLLNERQRSRLGLPHITITYLINAYNEHEVEECRRYFLGMGADRFFAKAINLNVHRRADGKEETDLAHWLPKKGDVSLYETEGNAIRFRQREGACTICMTPIVRSDGEVLLCCHDIFNTVKIGNVFQRGFTDLWLEARYKKLRSLGKERKLPICEKCGK